METLAEAVRHWASRRPADAAVVEGEEVLTWGDLAAAACGGPGQVHPVAADGGLHVLRALVAVTAAGGALAPIDPALPTIEREDLEERLHPSTRAARGADALALVLATSGTTRRPKLVDITHRNLRASAEVARDRLGIGPRDGLVTLTPFHHVLAVRAACDALWLGATVVVGDLHHPSATVAVGSPAALEAAAAVVERTGRRPHLRFVRSGSAILTTEVRRRVQVALGVPVLGGYGMTEAAKIASPRFPPVAGQEATAGEPTMDLRLVDGRIQVRGDGVTPGYHDDEVVLAVDADGWLDTGDLGELDGHGWLTVLGRADRAINRGGELVSPAAVSAAMLEHPRIAAVRVSAVAHPHLGQAVVATVRGPAGEPPPCPDALLAWAGDHVGTARRPDVVRVEGYVRQPPPPAGDPALLDAVRTQWTDLLGAAPGDDEDFVVAGGSSLLALELAVRLSELGGGDVPPQVVLEHRTVRGQARWLVDARRRPRTAGERLVPMAGPHGSGPDPTILLLPGVAGTAASARPVAQAIARALPGVRVEAIETPVRSEPVVELDDLAAAAAEAVLEADVAEVNLLGVCFGGQVAVEVARRLAEVGRPVHRLLLADTLHPAARRAGAPTDGGRVGAAARLLWSARGVLEPGRCVDLLRPLPQLPAPTSRQPPKPWRRIEHRRLEASRARDPGPLRLERPARLIASARNVRWARDATLGWRGTLAPLRVTVLPTDQHRLVNLDADLLAGALTDEFALPGRSERR